MNDHAPPDRTGNPARDDEIFLASLADSESAEDPKASDADTRKRRRATRTAIAVMLTIILGPILWRWCPAEVARWYAAVAAERQVEGDTRGADQAMSTAFWWDQQSAALYRQRGDMLVERGDHRQAIEAYDRAIALDPDDPRGLLQRSVAWQHLQRHAQAIEDWHRIVALLKKYGQDQSATALNGLAYARALGKVDLDLALNEINQALQFGGRDPEGRAAMLDTRGYIQYLRGDHQAARQDLDRAIETAELLLASRKNDPSYADLREQESVMQQLKHHVAVMRYHRALVLQALGEQELAAEDFDRVRQLGHEPDDRLF